MAARCRAVSLAVKSPLSGVGRESHSGWLMPGEHTDLDGARADLQAWRLQERSTYRELFFFKN
jgi:hypothetical protein